MSQILSIFRFCMTCRALTMRWNLAVPSVRPMVQRELEDHMREAHCYSQEREPWQR